MIWKILLHLPSHGHIWLIYHAIYTHRIWDEVELEISPSSCFSHGMMGVANKMSFARNTQNRGKVIQALVEIILLILDKHMKWRVLCIRRDLLIIFHKKKSNIETSAILALLGLILVIAQYNAVLIFFLLLYILGENSGLDCSNTGYFSAVPGFLFFCCFFFFSPANQYVIICVCFFFIQAQNAGIDFYFF